MNKYRKYAIFGCNQLALNNNIICKEHYKTEKEVKTMDIESLAKAYHEICREMVNKQIGMITKPTQPYIEWDKLTEEQKEGRRFIAKSIIEQFVIYPKKVKV